MSRSNWLYYLALGLILVSASPTLGQETGGPQDRPAQNQKANQADQEQSTDKPAPESQIAAPAPAAPTELSGGDHNTGSQPEYSDEPEKSFWQTYVSWKDTLAQWAMTIASFFAIAVSILAVWLIKKTLDATRAMVIEAQKTTMAAEEATAEAKRQANAMIQLEAAKLIVKRVALHPKAGGPMQTEGVPENGNIIIAVIENIGNTPAFPLRSCLLWKVRELPPEIRFPIAAVHNYPPGKIISPGGDIEITNAFGSISLNEDSAAAIQSGEAALWAYGSITYKDWFGIERTEEFILRWKGFFEPGEPHRKYLLGFVPYGKAE